MIGRSGLPAGRAFVDFYDPALRVVTVRVADGVDAYRLGWLTEAGWCRRDQPQQTLADWERE